MKAIIFREFKSFFGSLIGYLVICVFLLLNGLFLWVFDNEYNILNLGYNDLTPFFKFSPWILLLLIPAITMKSFSDEKRLGTLELLVTKPLSYKKIVWGKFFGALLLIIVAILPTTLYVWILNNYSLVGHSIDGASTLGSFVGLLFLAASYTAIGIFSSTLSENQIVCFLVAVLICLLAYFGIDQLAQLTKLSILSNFGMKHHFESLSRGVIDTRDLIYFSSIIYLMIVATIYSLKSQRQ